MLRKFTQLVFLLTVTAIASFGQNQTVFLPWCQGITYHWGTANNQYYTAIEQVSLLQGTSVLYNKPADGFQNDAQRTGEWGNYGHIINNPNNAVELVAGATYTLAVSLSTNQGYGETYWNAWLDFDNTKTFEATEVFSSTPIRCRHSGNTTPSSQETVTFTIPCNAQPGLTRIRIKNAEWTGELTPARGCENNNSTYRYGETEDLYVRIVTPTMLVADFIVPTNLWAGAPAIIFNSFPGQANYSWDKGNGVDFVGTNYQTVFPAGGTYNVTMIASNCLGTTSVTKAVTVRSIPQPPEADFVASRNVITEGDEITLFDLTLYGPNKWDWEITNRDDATYLQDNRHIRGGQAFNNSYFHPVFRMNSVGEFDVKLTSYNIVGVGMRGKARYIQVDPFSDFLLGVGVTQTELSSGRILDGGGLDRNYPSGNFDGNPNKNRLLIKPCGAEEITLTIEKLMLGSSAHKFMVWDGDDRNGTPLHPEDGFTRDNILLPRTLVAKSGSMYIEFDARATGSSEGIIANFSTKFGTTNKPIPFFVQEFPTQAYTKAEVFFKGGVTNLFGLNKVRWLVDNFEVAPAQITGDRMYYEFPEAGEYNVCLDVKSCAGDSIFCRKVNVIDPTGRTSLDFFASDDRPERGQNVVLNGVTDKANRFQWQIVPATYSINSGNLLSKYPNVSFNEPGAYSISLRAWNTFDSASSTRFLVKNNYVIVIDPCTPLAFESSEDVTNNRLRVIDNKNQVIFSHTSTGGNSYRSFLLAGNPVVNLTFGATYTIDMFRETTADTVSRAIYIDYNSNGIFESNELVLHQVKSRDQTASATFTVPSLENAYNGTTRLRTIVAYGTTNELNACGPGILAEYKDYRVSLNQNAVPPVITLNGDDTINLEVNASYTDIGATASDIIDGDISSSIQTQSNLDINQPGIYFTRYDVRNSSGVFAQTKFRQILVSADRTAPLLSLNGNLTDTIEVNSGPYKDEKGVAFDNVDGDLTSLIEVFGTVDHTQLGVYTLTYSVKDVQGNEAQATRTVYVVDRTAPEFVFSSTERVQLGKFWFDQTTVRDNYWPLNQIDFRVEIGMNGPVRWDQPGQYPITYRATDGSGNTAVKSRVYEVNDFIAPTILLNTPDTIRVAVKTNYNRITPTIFDNYYDNNQLTISFNENVNVNVLGMYVETYIVSDPAGNTTTKRRFVNVVDEIAPQIAGTDFCTQLGVDFNPMAGLIITDNYYTQAELLPLVTIASSNVNVWFEGIYHITYRVTDPSGNISNFLNRNVTVSEMCEVITSVNQTDANASVVVYPNPSGGLFTLAVRNGMGSLANVEVYSTLGARVYAAEINGADKLSIDLSGETSGVYMIKMTLSSGEQLTQRVILNQ